MPQYRESIDDLHRKYAGTYVFYDGEFSYVTQFDSDNDDEDIFISCDGATPYHGPFSEKKLEPIMKDSCYFNNASFKEKNPSGIAAIKYWRYPRRQWRRSLCEDIAHLESPMFPFYSMSGKRLPYWDGRLRFSVAKNLVFAEYPPIDFALKKLEDYQAIAISPDYCISLSSLDEKPLLSSMFGFIGVVEDKKFLIYHEPTLQEVSDFVRRTNQPFEVCLKTK